jgi:hypothetical protein
MELPGSPAVRFRAMGPFLDRFQMFKDAPLRMQRFCGRHD